MTAAAATRPRQVKRGQPRQPWPLGPARAWRIAGGRTDAIDLPDWPGPAYIVHNITIEKGDGPGPVGLCVGGEDENFEVFTLPIVAEIAARLTPWACWYWAPGWDAMEHYGGHAWGTDSLAVCCCALEPVRAVSTAFHEAWHLAEALIRPDLLADLDRQLATGPSWPGDYWPRAKERRARAFENFAMAALEGCRLEIGPLAAPEVAIFGRVFNGEFGREIMGGKYGR